MDKKMQELILKELKIKENESFSVEELTTALKLEGQDSFKELVKTLAEMERKREVKITSEGKFQIALQTPQLVGIFHANDRGFGFVTIDPEQPDVFVNPTQTMSALNGDSVEIEITSPAKPGDERGPEGKVNKIVEHNVTSIVGEFEVEPSDLENQGTIGHLVVKNKKLQRYNLLVTGVGLHPVAGEVVTADITAYPTSEKPLVIETLVKEVVGNKDDPGMDILQVVYQHDIPSEFPEDVMAQAEATPEVVLPEEKIGRVDLTDQKLVTIDSIDSKDLDDAVTAWKLDNGNYHLGVHIADVSHYVQPGTPLDREAYERGTSVYLTDRVIPMLPHKLSNGICSLNPKVERLAMSCEMEITPEGYVVSHKIFQSVIKTTERMTYKAINKILESNDEKTKAKYEELVPMFETMGELHKILEKMRKKRGAISFDDNESKIIVDESGHPIDIQIRTRGTSERMVESFMLAANETVAAHYDKLKVPFVYRIHETPKNEKVMRFFETLTSFGIVVKGDSKNVTPKMLQGVLKEVAGKPEESMVSVMLLRSMQQAKYTDESLGHFGLAATDYTHFTSPIRRYPDLMVHRLIRFYEENGVGDTQKEKYAEQLPEITTHASQMERRAIDAERDTDAMKKAEYMADHVGETFEGVVSSVMKFGVFVSLPNTVEGLVHISNMKDDYYEYLDMHMALVGKRTKRTFRIGQPIEVKVAKVDIEQSAIDFEIVNPQNTPTSDLRGKGGTFKRPSNGRPGDKKPYNRNGKPATGSSSNGKKPFYKSANKNNAPRKNNTRQK
ncbi:ribonuclease R [Dellaglioa algida]|uniref:ribonuclease R n=1 Tax=Dellaglioa algida TaxID=105612 RepID=UPI000BD89F7F|nr:ribonuclease R [Dellaglioa algida]MDK1718829.1 ribonuclease R [Dellaglioa algida]MDK1728264.1 ribonuclease R [Dellaglioa algida]MDK1730021.1 ribonuclease R [Dellaglioa algida]MDK1735912.1 ribonuclease R [Dellaglioa algida]MDK1737626.1 ribonuclease R [Dellaglioa algida]